MDDDAWAAHVARLELYELLARRQAGRCAVCDSYLPVAAGDVHHIRRRSAGGTDHPANLILIHRDCHRWIHDNPAAATEAGYLASRWTRPEDTDD